MPFLLCQKEDDLVDLLLQFIKLGAGKAPCQRDSKGIEGRAVQHTQLRTLRKYFMAWEIRSCVIARENIYRQNKKKYPPHRKWNTMGKIWRYSNRFSAFLPLIDT